MSETHAEIEQRERARGGQTLDDELGDLERQLKTLQENVQRLRRERGQAEKGD